MYRSEYGVAGDWRTQRSGWRGPEKPTVAGVSTPWAVEMRRGSGWSRVTALADGQRGGRKDVPGRQWCAPRRLETSGRSHDGDSPGRQSRLGERMCRDGNGVRLDGLRRRGRLVGSSHDGDSPGRQSRLLLLIIFFISHLVFFLRFPALPDFFTLPSPSAPPPLPPSAAAIWS